MATTARKGSKHHATGPSADEAEISPAVLAPGTEGAAPQGTHPGRHGAVVDMERRSPTWGCPRIRAAHTLGARLVDQIEYSAPGGMMLTVTVPLGPDERFRPNDHCESLAAERLQRYVTVL